MYLNTTIRRIRCVCVYFALLAKVTKYIRLYRKMLIAENIAKSKGQILVKSVTGVQCRANTMIAEPAWDILYTPSFSPHTIVPKHAESFQFKCS